MKKMKDYKKEIKKTQLKKKSKSFKLISKNKKAYFDYEIVEAWEAGIKLS
jgi:tmRNA-binding protein